MAQPPPPPDIHFLVIRQGEPSYPGGGDKFRIKLRPISYSTCSSSSRHCTPAQPAAALAATACMLALISHDQSLACDSFHKVSSAKSADPAYRRSAGYFKRNSDRRIITSALLFQFLTIPYAALLTMAFNMLSK